MAHFCSLQKFKESSPNLHFASMRSRHSETNFSSESSLFLNFPANFWAKMCSVHKVATCFLASLTLGETRTWAKIIFSLKLTVNLPVLATVNHIHVQCTWNCFKFETAIKAIFFDFCLLSKSILQTIS